MSNIKEKTNESRWHWIFLQCTCKTESKIIKENHSHKRTRHALINCRKHCSNECHFCIRKTVIDPYRDIKLGIHVPGLGEIAAQLKYRNGFIEAIDRVWTDNRNGCRV